MTLLRSTACVGALGLLAALAGCYDMTSEEPVITDANRVAQASLEPGRYCNADVAFDAVGAPLKAEITDDCFEVAVAGGTLTLTVEDPSEEAMPMDVADLGRGASLLQFHEVDDADEEYRLLYAFVRADGVLVLEEPPMSETVVAAAEAAGVTLSFPYEEAAGHEIEITGGGPDAALGFLREAAGLTFDAALRDPDLAYALKDDGIFYVRVGDDAAGEDRDDAAAFAKVGALVEALERAMALE